MQEARVRRTDPFSTFLVLSILPSTNVTATVTLGTIATVCFGDTPQSLTSGWKRHKVECNGLFPGRGYRLLSISVGFSAFVSLYPMFLATASFFFLVQVSINSPLYPVYCQLQKKTDKIEV